MSAPREEGLLRALQRAVRRPVPASSRGWISFALIVAVLLFLQGASGVLLSVYYLPYPDAAADSVRFIMREVAWGWLIRGVHTWGTAVILVLLALQLLHSLFRGTYRGARAGSWVIGMLVLLLVVGLAFTGELLVWDERSLALATAALEGTEAVPLVGPPLATLMRGGSQVGVATLARAHAAHALILPWLAFLLLMLDLWFRSRAGASVRGAAPSELPASTEIDGGER